MSKKHKSKPLSLDEPLGSLSRDIPVPTEELQTTMAEPQDRMLRYRKPPCPECNASPVVTIQRRGPYASYRCRACGFHFEEVR